MANSWFLNNTIHPHCFPEKRPALCSVPLKLAVHGSQDHTVHSCYLCMDFFQETSIDSSVRWQPGTGKYYPLLLRRLSAHTMCTVNSWATRAWYLPCGRVHDAASFLRSHSAAAAPFQCVMVHPEVVAQLMGQGHCGTKGAVWMVLKEKHKSRDLQFTSAWPLLRHFPSPWHLFIINAWFNWIPHKGPNTEPCY